MKKLVIGAHLSVKDGYLKAAQNAIKIDANTFQFFPRNPRGGQIRKLTPKEAEEFKIFIKANNFGTLIAHAPYTYNLASSKQSVREFTLEKLEEDLDRLNLLGVKLYNIHPGSHTGDGVSIGIDRIVKGLNKVIKSNSPIILIESMSGKGTEIGRNFSEIKEIINQISLKEKIGVCLDTAHMFGAGILNENYQELLEDFDKLIGLSFLKALHINDSKAVFNSHKDRHEKLGQGEIGWPFFVKFLSDKSILGLPVILETPNDLTGYKKEIKYLRDHIE